MKKFGLVFFIALAVLLAFRVGLNTFSRTGSESTSPEPVSIEEVGQSFGTTTAAQLPSSRPGSPAGLASPPDSFSAGKNVSEKKSARNESAEVNSRESMDSSMSKPLSAQRKSQDGNTSDGSPSAERARLFVRLEASREEFAEKWAGRIPEEAIKKYITSRSGKLYFVEPPEGWEKVAFEKLNLNPCSAVQNVRSPLVLRVSHQGVIEGAEYLNPDTRDPVPDGISQCTFKPYAKEGERIRFITTLPPYGKLE